MKMLNEAYECHVFHILILKWLVGYTQRNFAIGFQLGQILTNAREYSWTKTDH